MLDHRPALALVLSACHPSTHGPVRIDEIAYLARLEARRPGLMTMYDRSVDDPAWQALVITPEYRDILLEQDYATYDGVVGREYSKDDRQRDQAWTEALVEMARSPQPDEDPRAWVTHGDVYVGFRMDPPDPMADADGFTYKVFLGFTDFLTSLSPDRYAALSSFLEAHGVRGMSKVDLRPGATRFRYNQLVLYAASPEMAACVERRVQAFYGKALIRMARGIDVPASMSGGHRVDWHHFLLADGFERLPTALQDYVEYKAPTSTVPCGPD